MKITIVDYGMGNIKSITSTLNYLGVHDVILTNKHEDINNSDKIILPGVGSYRIAMNQIRENKIDKILFDNVIINKKPILGICLGMQLLGISSTEDGNTDGLKFVNGIVSRFDDLTLKIPHVGFNQVNYNSNNILYKGLNKSPDFYFTHSFKMLTEDNINQSLTNYGIDFVSSFEFNNIAGVQFHPELSQGNGLKLLNNFIKYF
jgi:glutamine amidotransferase